MILSKLTRPMLKRKREAVKEHSRGTLAFAKGRLHGRAERDREYTRVVEIPPGQRCSYFQNPPTQDTILMRIIPAPGVRVSATELPPVRHVQEIAFRARQMAFKHHTGHVIYWWDWRPTDWTKDD